MSGKGFVEAPLLSQWCMADPSTPVPLPILLVLLLPSWKSPFGDTAFRIAIHQGCDFPHVSDFRDFNHATVQHWGVWGIASFGMCGQSCPKILVYTYLLKN